LLLSFHGLSAGAADQEYFTGFSALADSSAGGFIVAYPQGSTSDAMPLSHWNAWQQPSPEPDDVAFTDQLLDHLQSQLCIDRSRVYANGASNGAMMAVRLACSLSDRIAAVSAVVALYYPPMSLTSFPNPNETCGGSRPVPIVAFHGTDDDIVPFQGGDGIWNFRLPIDDAAIGESALSAWALHNGCTGNRNEHQLSAEASLVSYDGCVSDATVQLYVVHGGHHTWPQLAPDPVTGERAVDATAQSWKFLSKYSLSNDFDGDGLPDQYEKTTFGCDPVSYTDDGDGLATVEEASQKLTNPCAWDSGSWGCANAPVRDPGCDTDTDEDRCMDAWELGPSPAAGGKRNPLDPWDYFNPSGDGRNRVDDVLAVLDRYYLSDSDPGYSTVFDRGGFDGPNAWDVRPPDGRVRIDDILAAVRSYLQDCP